MTGGSTKEVLDAALRQGFVVESIGPAEVDPTQHEVRASVQSNANHRIDLSPTIWALIKYPVMVIGGVMLAVAAIAWILEHTRP